MRKLLATLGIIAMGASTFAAVADAAYVSRCKRPEKWNAVEGKCEKPVKKAVKPAAKVAKKPA